jgi:hypothetical protein
MKFYFILFIKTENVIKYTRIFITKKYDSTNKKKTTAEKNKEEKGEETNGSERRN